LLRHQAPLLHTVHDGTFYLASEVKALAELGVPLRWDLARDQARRSGAEFCRVDVCSGQMADNFSDAIYHAERPFANAHAIAKYLLSRAVRDSGIKVVMTGEGSDGIFKVTTLLDAIRRWTERAVPAPTRCS
jgi:asparagine synthetase B (glutamine-hydrolysing)